MHRLLATLLIVTAALPVASASHGCSSTTSTQTVATVTIAESSTECHYTYFGTGYYQESSWEQDTTTASESSTGTTLTAQTFSSESDYVSTSGSSENAYDQASIYGTVGGRSVYVMARDSQATSTTYGCFGGTDAMGQISSSDGGLFVHPFAHRGDMRTLPCAPQDLREML